MTIDLSFDLETLGTGPDAVILEIGAVPFDPNGSDTAETLLPRAVQFTLPVQSQLDEGRKVDASTLQFWLSRRSTDAEHLFERVADQDRLFPHYSHSLDRFLEWCLKEFNVLSEPPVARSWANSPSFDHVKLRGLLERSCRYVPLVFSYRYERDVRTLRDFCDLPKTDVWGLTPHNAAHDAVYQALLVQEAHRRKPYPSAG